MTEKTVHEINDGTGTIITDHWPKDDPDEFPITIGCWYCGEKLLWQSDFMKDEWGMNGEGMVTVLLCSGCGAECRMIEPDPEEEKYEP